MVPIFPARTAGSLQGINVMGKTNMSSLSWKCLVDELRGSSSCTDSGKCYSSIIVICVVICSNVTVYWLDILASLPSLQFQPAHGNHICAGRCVTGRLGCYTLLHSWFSAWFRCRRSQTETGYQWACQVVLSINLDCQCKENLEKSIQWPFQTCRINSSTLVGEWRQSPLGYIDGAAYLEFAGNGQQLVSRPCCIVFPICIVSPLSSTWRCVPLRTLSLDLM